MMKRLESLPLTIEQRPAFTQQEIDEVIELAAQR